MARLLIDTITANVTDVKLTETCAVFSVSEICRFARACVGARSVVTVRIDVTIM